jgi:starch synthase
LISLKYGTIPIVRKTGGLADTIFDVDNSGKPFDETNGYVFDEPTNASLESALNRAFACWGHQQDKWRKLMVNGMNMDFSWNKPSNQYLDLYKKLMGGDNKKTI